MVLTRDHGCEPIGEADLASSCDAMTPRATLPLSNKTLLQANEVALKGTSMETVFRGMCEVLRKVVQFDRAGLTLYDSEHDSLRIAALYGPYERSFFQVGHLLARNDSQNGWTFERKAKTIRRDLPRDFRFTSEEKTAEEGFRSLCSVPLVIRGNSVGVVTIVAARKDQFSTRLAEVVQQISNQIALAVWSFVQHCPTHVNTKLLCPRCIGSAGGKTTTEKHRANLSDWGRKGGRSRNGS